MVYDGGVVLPLPYDDWRSKLGEVAQGSVIWPKELLMLQSLGHLLEALLMILLRVISSQIPQSLADDKEVMTTAEDSYTSLPISARDSFRAVFIRFCNRRFVPLDLVTYIVLMKGLCDQGKVKEAHQLFHRMIDRGFSPDTLAYNSLICRYGKERKMQEAKSLYREMIQRGLSPDSTTCHLLIKGYGKVGKLLSSLNLVVEFQRLGVLTPLELYNYLEVALCQENRSHAAKSLLRKMVIDGCELSLEMYN
ncbi:hypothetical protein IFM89_029719 [Coptis chinensis]|uniref:Pentatricopeptide repeat-containing protein n=1 Tax=Coptis chinensis TaxID=261450 RepID=A0A835H1D5_9MAGN|nr:hypothetical protein IFM89_029719 [Coptis chinensis]